jgi:hypothetical protein
MESCIRIGFKNNNNIYEIPIDIMRLYPNSIIWGYYDSTKQTNIIIDDIDPYIFEMIYDVLMNKTRQYDLPNNIKIIAHNLGLISDDIHKIELMLERDKQHKMYTIENIMRNEDSYCMIDKQAYEEYCNIFRSYEYIVPFQLVLSKRLIPSGPALGPVGYHGDIGPTGATGPIGATGPTGVPGLIVSNTPYFLPIATDELDNQQNIYKNNIKMINIWNGLPIQLTEIKIGEISKTHILNMKKIDNGVISVNEARDSAMRILAPCYGLPEHINSKSIVQYNESVARYLMSGEHGFFKARDILEKEVINSNYAILIDQVIKIINNNAENIVTTCTNLNQNTCYGFINCKKLN